MPDDNEDWLKVSEEVSDKSDDGTSRISPPKLVTFNIVNSLGNEVVDTIRDDGQPIKLSSKLHQLYCEIKMLLPLNFVSRNNHGSREEVMVHGYFIYGRKQIK